MAMSASSPAPMTSATRVVSQDPSNGDRARDSVVGKLRIKPFRGKKFEKFFTAFEEAADAAKWMDDRKMLKFHEYLRNEALYVWKGIIQDLSEPGKRIRWMDATKMYREVYMTDTDKEEKRQRERALNSFIEKTNKNKKERNDAKNATKVMLLAAGMGLSEKRLVRAMMKVISKESVRRLENARPAPNTPREVLELIKKLAPKPTDIQKVIRSSYRKKAAEATDSSDSESSSDESASDTESDMSTDKGFALDYTDSTDESSEGEAELVSRARKARRVVEKTRAKPKEEKREEKKSEVDVLTEQISQLVLLVQRQEIEKQKAAAEKKEVANTYKGCFYCDQKDHAMKYCPMLREDERKGIVVQKDGLVCMASGELVPRATSVTGPMRNYVLRQMRESVIKPVEESRMPRSVNFIRADRVKSPIDIASDDNYDSEAEVLYAEELQGEYEVDMAEKRRRAVGDDANRVSGIPEVQDTRPQRVVRPRTQEPMAPSVNSVPSTPALTSPVTRAATWGRQSEPQDAIMRGTLRGPPAFRYVAPVEKAGADERTMDLLMQTTVAIPIADLLSVSQSIRSLMQKQVTRVKVSNPASSASTANWIEGEVLGSYVEMPMSADVMNETRIIGYPPYATKSVQVEGFVNGKKLSLVIDPGSELNVCNADLFEGMGMLVTPDNGRIRMKGVTGHTAMTRGVCYGFEVRIGEMRIETSALAVNDFKYQLLLGLPFLEEAKWRVARNKEGRTVYLLESAGIQVAFGAIDPRHDPKMKVSTELSSINRARRGAVGFDAVPRVNMVVAGDEDESDDEFAVNNCKIELPDGPFIIKVPEDGEFQVDGAKFKRVAIKVRPVATQVPEEMQLSTIKREKEAKLMNKEGSLKEEEFIEGKEEKVGKEKRLTQERLLTLNIGDGWLTEKEVEFIRSEVQQADRAFAFTDEEMGLLDSSIEPPIRVPTVPHEPWNLKPFPVKRALYDRVIELLKTKMHAGVVEPSIGAYSSRWFLVEKKDSSKLRFIQDMQPANRVTVRNNGKPPAMDEITEDAGGRVLATTFDLYSGYDQLPLDERDRDIFTIDTPIGLLRMTRLPQGWTNSVGIFQRIMYKVLINWIPDKVRIFMDDGIILGPRVTDVADIEEKDAEGIRAVVRQHVGDVIGVLQTFIKAGLTISGTKSFFGVTKFEILGVECSSEGRKPCDKGIAKVRGWPIPKNKTDIRAFVSTCCFSRHFIKDFSLIAAPLYLALRKELDFEWTDMQQKAFEDLKDAMTSAPVLRAPVYGDDERPLILTTDASPVAAGAVLQQNDVNGKRYIILYESKKFNDVEKRYAQVKRELYAIYTMVKKLRHYLYGGRFILETDAKSIIGMINNPDLPNDAASRWIAYLMLFDFEIKHIAGKDNAVADALSRTDFDINNTTCGQDVGFDGHVSKGSGVVVLDDSAYLFLGIDSIEQAMASEIGEDSEFYDISFLLRNGYVRQGVNKGKEKKTWELAREYFVQDGLLFKRRKESMPLRVIVDKAMQMRITIAIHEGHPTGHRGIKATYRLLAVRFHWRGMYAMVEEVVRSCEVCQKHSGEPQAEPLMPHLGSTLFARIGVDLVVWPEVDISGCW